VAVEVKAANTSSADVFRGIFQCVKYQAVLEAQLKVDVAIRDAHTFLIYGGELNQEERELKNILGVSVIEGVREE